METRQSLATRVKPPQCKTPSRHCLTVLALATLLTAGCAAKGEPPPPAPTGLREHGQLLLTRADHNQTVELQMGERLVVRLPENPSIGYTWAIDETDHRLLTLDSTDYTAPTEGSIGARGQRPFTFTARQPGEVALKLKYWRFWEGDASVTERYVVNLRILPQRHPRDLIRISNRGVFPDAGDY